MRDRIPTYPGRIKLTAVPGAKDTFDMVRADVPLEEGTPLNKATLLADSTAALLGLGADATPDDAVAKLANRITYGTEALTPGVSSLATGGIYVQYE